MRLKNIKNYINGMDKFVFIKQLLENEKFNPSQKERFLKLVTNELEKSSGNQASILSDIETIKNELNIKSNTKATQSIKAFVNTTNLPIVDNAPAEVVAVTDNKTVNKFNFSGKVLSYTTGEITRAANAVTLIVDEVIESIINQFPRHSTDPHLLQKPLLKLYLGHHKHHEQKLHPLDRQPLIPYRRIQPQIQVLFRRSYLLE